MEKIETILANYWSTFLGVPINNPAVQKITVIAAPHSPGLFAFSRDNGVHWLLALNPDTNNYRNISEALYNLDEFAGDTAVKILTDNGRQLGSFFGPAAVMYCSAESFRPRPAANQIAVRRFDQNEAEMAAFQQTNNLEWSLDQPEWLCAFGAYQNNQLAATAAVRVWGNVIGELYVDTLANYRRQGLGKAVVSAATNYLLHSGLVPQYVTESDNTPSIRLAQAVGYWPYAHITVCEIQ